MRQREGSQRKQPFAVESGKLSTAVSHGHTDLAVDQELDIFQATRSIRRCSESPGVWRQFCFRAMAAVFRLRPVFWTLALFEARLVYLAQPLKHRMGQPQSIER